jgi:hypothetical protein
MVPCVDDLSHTSVAAQSDFGLSQVKPEDDLSMQQDPTAYAGTPLWFVVFHYYYYLSAIHGVCF